MDETVKKLVSEHSSKWQEKGNDYWLQRLMQEVGELASVLANDHDDTIEHELAQIASIAINWLRKLAKPGYHIETQLNRFGLWEAFLYNDGNPVTWVSSYSTKDQAVIAIKQIGKVTDATVNESNNNWLRWEVLQAVRNESKRETDHIVAKVSKNMLYKITHEWFGDGGEATIAETQAMVDEWQTEDFYYGWTLKVEASGSELRIYAHSISDDAKPLSTTWLKITNDMYYVIIGEEVQT